DSVEGDIDKIMEDLGVGYMTRTMMYAWGYGVDELEFEVTQSGDTIHLSAKTPIGDKECTILAHGAEFDYTEPSTDEEMKATAFWEGPVLVLKTDKEESRRFIDDYGNLVLETTTCSGAKAVRTMRRK
ncbi:FABP4, partial [Symbiodinium pilosum]